MNYYGNKVDPVEVRNYQYAKGVDAYNASNRGELRFATYHAKDRDPLLAAAPPAPAYAGPHAADIAQEINKKITPALKKLIPYHPDQIGEATADALLAKGFLQHPLPQHGGASPAAQAKQASPAA